MNEYCEFEDLVGKTLVNIEISEDKREIIFKDSEDSNYIMHHIQECCEDVWLEDVVGELEDLFNSSILLAECVESDRPEDAKTESESYDETWTFYKLSTNRGSVTLRWCGQSNGYYSESVSFAQMS